MNFLKVGARTLNRYTQASVIAVVVYVVFASALSLARPLWEPVLGPVRNGHFHPINFTGVMGLFILVLVVIFLSFRALKTINGASEVGKTFSWIMLIGSATAVLIWLVLICLFYLAALADMLPDRTNVTSEQNIGITATIDPAFLTTTSKHPKISGTASGVNAVFITLADKGEGIWHSEPPIPVVAGKWSVIVSPDYSLPPGQYSIIVSGPDNPQNTLPALTTATLLVTPSN